MLVWLLNGRKFCHTFVRDIEEDAELTDATNFKLPQIKKCQTFQSAVTFYF